MANHAGSSFTRIRGRYEMHASFASGGMATVHFGRIVGDVGFSRTVAVKRLHPSFARDPQFVAMLVDEARLAARIRHPNVVAVLDAVAHDGELFIVMEYVVGESLSLLLSAARERGERVPPTIAASVAGGLLRGLHAAHEAKTETGEPLGIVHRDVTPHNVLVGVDGIARVLDFGIAKATERAQTTREGHLKGKLRYIAPELLSGTPPTRRTDVYASAMVLWETLTGERLFEAPTEAGIMGRILEGVVIGPSRHVLGLPAELDRIVLRGLARDPRERFASAREMAAALDEVVRSAPPDQVGAWVEDLAHASLARRAELVAAIEAGLPPPRVANDVRPAAQETPTKTTPEPASDTATVPLPRRTTRARRYYAGAAFVGASAALAGWLVLGRPWTAGASAVPHEAEADSSAVGGRNAAAPSSPLPSSGPSTAPMAPEDAIPTATPSTSIATPRQVPPPHRPMAAPKCDPPTYIDRDGISRVKRGCLP